MTMVPYTYLKYKSLTLSRKGKHAENSVKYPAGLDPGTKEHHVVIEFITNIISEM